MAHSDVYGQALLDFYQGCFEPPLLLHNSYGKPEEMPVEVFFRAPQDLVDLEQYALQLCCGRILDVGAGAGAHSLVLQEAEEDSVVAIESSALACQVMSLRGVRSIVHQDIFKYNPKDKFDTLLMLMNGTGIAGTINNFKVTLQKLGQLLTANGRIIIDSTDISYLYPQGLPADHYFGNILYQYDYKGQRGPWFPWLYMDQNMLKKLSWEAGFVAQIVYEGNEDEYLAVIQR